MEIKEMYKQWIGHKFGHMTITDILPKRVDGKVIVHCKCDCGNEKDVRIRHLVDGGISTCGLQCKLHHQAASERYTVNLVGKRFGKLTVLSKTDKRSFSYVIWHCKCDCGRECDVSSNLLMRGNTKSCGKCGYKDQRIRESCLKYKTPIERRLGLVIFAHMYARCYNPNNFAFGSYGGRGITICQEWLNDRMKFVRWAIENGYKRGLSIDRIDNNGPYAPWNCRWVDSLTQNNNKSSNHFVDIDGIVHTVSEWARICKINPDRIYWKEDEEMPSYIKRFLTAKASMSEEEYNDFIRKRLF